MELGQGVVKTGPCTGDNAIDLEPKSTFVNGTNGSGIYYLSSIKVSGIPASCHGRDFRLSFYDSNAGSSALPIFSYFGENNRVATVYNNAGYFQPGFQSSGTEVSSSSGAFTLTFKTPLALATNVTKATLETDFHKDWAEASFSSSWYHTCAVTSTGAAKCWGYNNVGQLGYNNYTQTQVVPGSSVIGLGSGVIQISAGVDSSCALLITGTVKCWGDDSYGQLGNGAGGASPRPVDVSNLSGVSAITSGFQHTCALLRSGGVKCWGRNGDGQLGNNTSTTGATTEPVDVSGLSSGVTAIGAAHFHTCAVLRTGEAKCWGRNGNGQLGNGSKAQALIPVAVTGLSAPAIATAGGEDFNCILLASGRVQCAGRAYEGQLGFGGTSTDRLSDWPNPVTVSGITTAVAISAGRRHACVLLSTGAVRCWGINGNYQLGINNTTQQNTPVEPSGLSSGVRQISASLEHTCAVLSAGVIPKCWGQRANGRLGNNTNSGSSQTPLAISGIP